MITIKEIAKKAEVSIGTVDRVLHNRGRVAQVTKEKILAIAKKGNYSSNIYARNLKLNRTYQIAVILPDDNPYWDKHREGIDRGIGEYGAMGFAQKEFVVSTVSEESRASAIKKALESSPDGLVLSPNMLTKGSKAVEMLNETNVPYVFVDATMEEMKNLSFVGQDAYQSGVMAGSLLSNSYDANYNVWVITLSKSDVQNKAINFRVSGLESYFERQKEVKITQVNMEAEGLLIADLKKKLLAEQKAVHLFLPHSKSHMLLHELYPLRKQLNMRIVGYDLVEKNVNFLKNGWIDYLIDQQPIKQGYLAVQMLYKHLILKSGIPKNQYLPLDIITKENLMYCDY